MMLGETPAIRIPAWTSASDVYSGRNFSCGNGYGEGGELYSYFYSDGGGLSSAVVFPASYDRCLSDDGGEEIEAMDSPVDAYSCDEFRMYEFKVRKCARGRSHDWTECPYAHPGEKARRRDPRKYHYSGTPCPDFRKGSCRRGDFCEFAHGVFECWLHPARYRTQPCKDGLNCRRRVCFFAHTPDQLRILPQTASDESPLRRHTLDAYITISPPSNSPPLSSVNEMVALMQQLQLSNAMSVPASCASPHGLNTSRPSFYSLPTTPTATKNRSERIIDGWEEPKKRVESGRSLRAKLYERLSKENFSEKTTADEHEEAAAVAGPDVGWITELLK